MRFSRLDVVRMTESKFECEIVRLRGQRVELCFFIARQVYPDIGTSVKSSASSFLVTSVPQL